MSIELVHLQFRQQVAVVTLDSPHNRNALSATLRSQLLDALATIEAQPHARAILLTHTGPVFSSGMDLTEIHRVGTPGPALTELAVILKALTRNRLPVVARVGGPTRAGGIGLVAAADVVVASDAADFSLTEVRLGVHPAIITVPLLRRVSTSALRELLLTAEIFGAEHAQRIGLVNTVAAAADLDTAVAAVLGNLLQGAPQAIARTKALLADDLTTEDEHYASRIAISVQGFTSLEAAEGQRARLEKRPPAWAPVAPFTVADPLSP